MPQICVPVAILLKTITPEIYIKKGVVYGTTWDAPDMRTCCHFAQNNHPRNLHKKGCRLRHPLGCPRSAYLLPFCSKQSPPKFTQKRVSFTAPLGMPQISVPVAILLKTITPEIYTKKGVVYGTPWDAPDQRTCCHFAQTNHPRNLHKKRVLFMAPPGMPQISVPLAILLKTITPEIYTK